MAQMIMFNVKGVAYSDEITENYHPKILNSARLCGAFLALLALCFGFIARN